MEISFAGKGGSGKTMLVGTLARVLARRGHTVRAVDADSNPNLAIALGVATEDAFDVRVLPADVARREVHEDGSRHTILAHSPEEIFARFGIDAPDGIRLLVGSRIAHAGGG